MIHRIADGLSRTRLLLGLLLLMGAWGCQQTPPGGTVRVGEIRPELGGTPAKFVGLNVTIRGTVNSKEPPKEGAFGNGYLVRDEYGDVMLVRTTNDIPALGTEWFLTGTIVQSADGLFLAEATRRRVGFDWQDSRTILLIAIGAVLVLLLGLIVWASLRPEAPLTETRDPLNVGTFTSHPPSPGGADFSRLPDLSSDITKTVPLPGGGTVSYDKTRRLLPGMLMLMDGANEHSPIYLYSQDSTDQVEIGRKSPDVSSGIRIDDRTATLSRHQAWIKYLSAEDRFQIRNGTAANPTVLNGQRLAAQEVADLPDESTLSMGAVNFKFVKKA